MPQISREIIDFFKILALLMFISDSDYEAFLENLSKKVEPFPSAEVYVEQMELNKTTSMIKFLPL